MTVAQVLIMVAGAMLLVAGLLALWRLATGPTSLDRAIASDVVLAVLIVSVAAHAIWTRTAVGLPVILVLSLLGFTGSVGLARLITGAAQQRSQYARDRADQEQADTDAEGGASA